MALPREKLKGLAEMTVPELKDLLLRQEKLINNKGFVNRLPDKGAKIQASIERAQATLRTRDAVNHTADLFNKMALDADSARTRRGEEGDGSDILGAIVNHPEDKLFIDEREESDLHLQESYVRVIKDKPEKEASSAHRFRPNSLNRGNKPKHSTVPTPPLKLSSQPPPCDVMDVTGSTSHRKLKHRYDDSLEENMHSGQNIHESAKMISIQESAAILHTQTKKLAEYQNKQAMERLAQKLNFKVGSFDPEGSRKMAYRLQEVFDSDDDSSDGEKEKDYGDEPKSSQSRTQ